MAATIIICIILAALLFLAVRRMAKKGACDCSSCESAGCCPSAQARNGKQ